MNKLGVLYYTSNHLDKENPFFLKNTKQKLVEAIGELPLYVISHQPTSFEEYKGQYVNLVAGNEYPLYKEGRHHLNIYWQILIGAENMDTEYVALAEDDILYSHAHFHSPQLYKDMEAHPDTFLYDMNKVSLFTWTDPPIFSFRTKRKVVNQLVAPRKLLIDALHERFFRYRELIDKGRTEESIIKYWGDLGRYEKLLGVTPRASYEYYCDVPSIVFTHPKAYGYEFNHGKRKKHGDLRIVELADWGKASDILKLWGNNPIQ